MIYDIKSFSKELFTLQILKAQENDLDPKIILSFCHIGRAMQIYSTTVFLTPVDVDLIFLILINYMLEKD
jgi:hypothetical protein